MPIRVICIKNNLIGPICFTFDTSSHVESYLCMPSSNVIIKLSDLFRMMLQYLVFDHCFDMNSIANPIPQYENSLSILIDTNTINGTMINNAYYGDCTYDNNKGKSKIKMKELVCNGRAMFFWVVVRA